MAHLFIFMFCVIDVKTDNDRVAFIASLNEAGFDGEDLAVEFGRFRVVVSHSPLLFSLLFRAFIQRNVCCRRMSIMRTTSDGSSLVAIGSCFLPSAKRTLSCVIFYVRFPSPAGCSVSICSVFSGWNGNRSEGADQRVWAPEVSRPTVSDGQKREAGRDGTVRGCRRSRHWWVQQPLPLLCKTVIPSMSSC